MNAEQLLEAVSDGESADWVFKSARGNSCGFRETCSAKAHAAGDIALFDDCDSEEAFLVDIDRFADRIELSNPGTLLVSIDQLRQGAISECRNPSLQRMFQLIGAGDKAGSGIDKIRRGWESQQWRSPTVIESAQPDRVSFSLPMVSLIPPDSELRLRALFGPDYDSLTPIEVQALVTADLEGEVSNRRLQLIRMEHPVELTKVLQGPASRGFLDQFGQKRGTSYRLSTWATADRTNSTEGAMPTRPSGASSLAPGATSLAPGASSLAPGASSHAPGASSHAPEEKAPDRGGGREDEEVSPTLDPRLLEIAKPAREKPRLSSELSRTIIRKLCARRYLTADQIAVLMKRGRDKLQKQLLSGVVDSGELLQRFPDHPTHPEQAYIAKESP